MLAQCRRASRRIEQRATNDAKDSTDFRDKNSEQERFGLLYNGLPLTCGRARAYHAPRRMRPTRG